MFSALYADDQILFSTSPDSIKIMLDNLDNYCQTNKLKVITKKTKIMVLKNYLSVNLYKNGCRFRTQKNFSDKGSKSLFGLFFYFLNMHFQRKRNVNCFDKLVLPVIHYASEI